MGSFPLKCLNTCVCACVCMCVHIWVHACTCVCTEARDCHQVSSWNVLRLHLLRQDLSGKLELTGQLDWLSSRTQGVSTGRDQCMVIFPVLREQMPATSCSFCYMDAGDRNLGVCACKSKQSKASALLGSCKGLSEYPCCGWPCGSRASENCSTSHTGTGTVTHVFIESPRGLISTCHRVNTW